MAEAGAYQSANRNALLREATLEHETFTKLGADARRGDLERLRKTAPELAHYRSLVAAGRQVEAGVYLQSAHGMAVRRQADEIEAAAGAPEAALEP
jgi:hypothetical protein